MTQNSRFWDGVLIGDATEAPYDAPNEFASVLRSLNGANANLNKSGVCRDELNELACSTPGGLVVTVATGRAFVHGTWYENDANVSFNIDATPVTQSRYDIVVLQKTWLTQQVRLAIHKGVDAVTPSVPAATQTDLTLWEFPICTVYVDPAGSVVLTDTREYVPYLAGAQFEKIDEVTLLAADDVVLLSTRGTVYSAYMMVINAKAVWGLIYASIPVCVYFNTGDLTGYSDSWISAFGGVTTGQDTNTWAMEIGSVPCSFSAPEKGMIVSFFNSLQTPGIEKKCLSFSDNLDKASPYVLICSGHCNTAGMVVNSINITSDIPGAQFDIGSTFKLYGIV